MLDQVLHQQIEANGINLHIASLGDGPLVVLCHGFPGLWYSWRHQMPALAQAGYRAVAMDMRGYGQSSRPVESEQYRFDKTSADVLAVLDHFNEDQAVVFGHDFGANLAWHMSVHHSDRIRAIASLCVPFAMPLAGGGDVLPSTLYAQIAQNHFFHMHYYQAIGVAESSCLGREREFLAKLFWALCAEGELLSWENYPMEGTKYIDVLAMPPRLPPWPWLSAEDLDYYVAQYLHAGEALAFVGGANSYRAMDHNWLQFRDAADENVRIPALYVGGEEDPTVKLGSPDDFLVMQQRVPDLRGMQLLPNAGHFLQQEQPEALNRVLLDFLSGL